MTKKFYRDAAVAALMLLMLFGCASTDSVTSTSMPTGQQVVPPYGFIAFCLHTPTECSGGTDHPRPVEMTAARWSELNAVNDFVNNTVPKISDQENYGVAEKWAYPNERGGDCEDLALMKRRMLIERGWPVDALLMTVAREPNDDGHAVLVIRSDKGDYVLDNLDWRIEPWAASPYAWVKQQSPLRPYLWVNLDQPTFRAATNQIVPPLSMPAPFISAAKEIASAEDSTSRKRK